MRNKILKYEQEYLAYQYDLVDALDEYIKSLDTTNKQELTLFITIGGYIYNIFFRIKGIQDFLKRVLSYDLTIPLKYDKYVKGLTEPYYLKQGDIYTISDEKLELLVNTIKNSKKD